MFVCFGVDTAENEPSEVWHACLPRAPLGKKKNYVNWYISFDFGTSGFFRPSVPNDFTFCKAIVDSSVLMVYNVPS